MRCHALVFGTFIFSCISFAQEVTAGVYGTVFDASTSAVPRASITLRWTGTSGLVRRAPRLG